MIAGHRAAERAGIVTVEATDVLTVNVTVAALGFLGLSPSNTRLDWQSISRPSAVFLPVPRACDAEFVRPPVRW